MDLETLVPGNRIAPKRLRLLQAPPEGVFLLDTSYLPSPAIPADALVIQLRDNAKEPATRHGHHSGVPLADLPALGRNIGIVLDGRFIAVDIDNPHAEQARFLERRLAEHPTWQQKTGHGRHYLYRVPQGFKGHNTALGGHNAADGAAHYADIKSLGYIVAPGSAVLCTKPCKCGLLEYTMENDVDPVMVPEWLLLELEKSRVRTQSTPVQETSGIPSGKHNQYIFETLCSQRAKYGLAEAALLHVARGLLPVLEGVNEADPFTEAQLARLAHSAARYDAPEADIGPILPKNTIRMEDVSLITEPARWWVPGILHSEHLTLVYGDGGAGKTTLASHVVADVTRQGGMVYLFCIEESPIEFTRRAVMMGAIRENIHAHERPSGIHFPKHLPALREIIAYGRYDMVYFDSITSHKDTTAGLNIAERTRLSFGPLEELCQERKVAMYGNFHKNAQGEYSGSTEMLNVPRHVLHVRRKLVEGAPLQVLVKKSNLDVDRSTVYQFLGTKVVIKDPLTGKVQKELTPDGYREVHCHTLTFIEPLTSEQADRDWTSTENLAGIGLTPAQERKRIIELLNRCTDEEIANSVGCSIERVASVRKRTHV